jgi:hypothetical protein
MSYHIKLAAISLDQYQEKLQSKALVPSRMILRDDIQNKFAQIKAQGISNLKELSEALKNKKKLHEFAGQSHVPADYLTILNREIKSNLPKPNRFQDFNILGEEVVARLEKHGIKHTKHLFEQVLTPAQRKALSQQTGIEEDEILKLTKLTDLSRIRWVNHTFAIVLFKAGYDTAQKVAEADFQALYDTIIALNKAENLYRGNIGLKDMKICVEAANEVSFDIVY